MPALDQLVVRVVRRYVAQVWAERLAREVQRRSEGLVTVHGPRDDDHSHHGDDNETDDEASTAPGTARSSSP